MRSLKFVIQLQLLLQLLIYLCNNRTHRILCDKRAKRRSLDK